MADADQPSEILAQGSFMPAFPQNLHSVFGTVANFPGLAVNLPHTPPAGAVPDFSTAESLDSFAQATGVPDIAHLFAEAIGACNAEDLFHIPRDVWDQLVRATIISRSRTDEFNDVTTEERNLSGVEMGKMNKGRDSLHIAAKVELEESSRAARPKAAAPAPWSPDSKTASGPDYDVSVKLSQVIDDTLTGTVNRMDNLTWSRMAKAYKDKYGALPKKDQEPSIEQVSALRQLLAMMQGPYVNFGLWGPHGRRVLRKLVHEAAIWDPTSGKMVTNTHKGPGSFDVWCKGWAVFKNAMLYLEEASVAAMDGYRDHIQELSQTYPSCWFIIYIADCRCRSEQLEYILRDVTTANLSSQEGSRSLAMWDFDENKPWDFVFKLAVSEENMAQHAFWQREVHIKCAQYLNRTISFAGAVGDGTTLQSPYVGKRGKGQEYGGDNQSPTKRPYNPSYRTRDQRTKGPQQQKGGGKGSNQKQQQGGWKKQEWPNQQNANQKWQNQSWQKQDWQKQEWQQQPKGGGPKGSKGKGDKGGKGNKGDKGGKTGKGKNAVEE